MIRERRNTWRIGRGSPLLLAALIAGGAALGTPVGVSATRAAEPVAPSAGPVSSASSATRTIDVLEIAYFPLTPDGQHIDIAVTGDVGGLFTDVKAHVARVSANVTEALSFGTAYRGYANPSAPRDLAYNVVASLEFLTPVPSIPSTFNPSYPKRADYATIMTSIDVCDHVLNHGVDEIWIWAYQGPHQLDISESKMSGPNGDISNSYRLNDMPYCGRSYLVYTYNYGRGTAEAVEDHGHQIEAELAHVDAHLLRDLFMGPNYPATLGVVGRCGSIHNPPNARFEYDRFNPDPNSSDCLAWTPDGIGALSPISCANWGCDDNGDADNPARNYQVWWMQNLPGIGNTVSYEGRRMGDWWDVYYDFDGVMASHPSLTLAPPSPWITPLPTYLGTTSIGLSWGAAVGADPVATYDVRYRRAAWNGGFGSYVTWQSATTDTGATFPASPGSTYCFSVLARDTLAMPSAWTAETCTAVPLDDRSLGRSSGWTAGTGSAYYRSTYLRSSAYGAKLTRTGAVAKRIALVATTCPTCGKVRVYWGSTLLRTISLYSATTVNRKLITVTTFTGTRTGTLSVKVHSRDRKVIIDGVAIRRS
jgi:hypothetical protein